MNPEPSSLSATQPPKRGLSRLTEIAILIGVGLLLLIALNSFGLIRHAHPASTDQVDVQQPSHLPPQTYTDRLIERYEDRIAVTGNCSKEHFLVGGKFDDQDGNYLYDAAHTEVMRQVVVIGPSGLNDGIVKMLFVKDLGELKYIKQNAFGATFNDYLKTYKVITDKQVQNDILTRNNLITTLGIIKNYQSQRIDVSPNSVFADGKP